MFASFGIRWWSVTLFVLGPTAPGICDVFRLVLDIDTLTPMSCQQNVLWARHLFLGRLRDLVPSCWLEDGCLDTFSVSPRWQLLFPVDFFRIIQSKRTIYLLQTILLLRSCSYKFSTYLFACWYAYSILRTFVPGPKHPLANKPFDIFVSTMALSCFGPYCPLWHQHTQTKCIGVIPTPWAMTHVLGLVSFPPQHE